MVRTHTTPKHVSHGQWLPGGHHLPVLPLTQHHSITMLLGEGMSAVELVLIHTALSQAVLIASTQCLI